ncbi:response regulator [Candidatus Magnetaquicoccus inordinatus]|uniref:response regulator n=1 Tax=Candidatus Magnetaquicoccus inordinatus TaxID=2496818 RepID=UPI00102B1CC8|nr:response regulator [Candidatus Magnetaquicoccus inordinatus]
MKILIVDDVVANRIMLGNFLTPLGQCDMATNGVEALDWVEAALAENRPYDLILLDIMMPKMDGQETLKAIRDLEQTHQQSGGKEAVILMVTAYDAPEMVTQAFFKGYCTDFLSKPITRQVLMDKLQEYGLLSA